MKTSCSLCGQPFEKLDPDLEKRKLRHEGHHSRRNLSKNQIIDKVKWLWRYFGLVFLYYFACLVTAYTHFQL